MAAQLVVKLPRRRLQFSVSSILCKVFHSGLKIQVPLLLSVFFLQSFLHGLVLQQLAFRFIQQTEAGRNPAQAEILAHKIQAEGVDSLNPSGAQQGQLAAEPAAARILRQLPKQAGRHPLPHFPGGSVGKGDDQQGIDIRRVFHVRDAADHSLHQHGGFAASRSGGYNQSAASAIDSALLLWRKFNGHFLLPPLPDAEVGQRSLRR